MARTPNTDARRAQIVDAFLTVMAERGYDGASTSLVAKTAGLNQGLLHYHFSNKEAVLLEALRTLALEHETRLDAAFDAAGPDPLQRIAAFITAHVGLGAHADMRALKCWVAMASEASRRPAVREVYEQSVQALTKRLQDVLQAALDAELIHHRHPQAAAIALYAAIQGYFDLAASVPDRIPRGSAAPSIMAMATGLLAPANALGGQP